MAVEAVMSWVFFHECGHQFRSALDALAVMDSPCTTIPAPVAAA
jgi:hypothetical protein